MCGIFCALSETGHLLPSEELKQRLANRGPDSQRIVEIKSSGNNYSSTRPVCVTFLSTVLSLRGSNTVIQPYQSDDRKYTLCWNGEAWSIGTKSTFGNDTEAVFNLLVNTLKALLENEDGLQGPLEAATEIAKALSTVAGPYAFVFFDHDRGQLFFGRDFLGRRSMLKRSSDKGDLILSSISDGEPNAEWTEVEADGVYCIDLQAGEQFLSGSTASPTSSYQKFGDFHAVVVPYRFSANEPYNTGAPVSVIPRLSLNKALSSSQESLNDGSAAVTHLQKFLTDSTSLRVLNIPDPPLIAGNDQSESRARLAITFSGGLDCTVLARISHDLLPPNENIDLLNVAFENPRIHRAFESENSTAYELCPDRITGRATYNELLRVCPDRQWRFVAINVPYTEALEHRQKVISLMHPHNTEMDLSISYALYFAARGTGQVSSPTESEAIPSTTSARVLLSGLGADELFGGYVRHATAFRRGGLLGLLDELELDVSRLGKRNLGRDDRVMAHWSKEVRFPYLDESVLSWALNAPVTEKCGFGEPDADNSRVNRNESEALEPGKKLLRCLARRLGMNEVSKEKKRAIQFGARTARMETRKTKGTQLLS